MSVKFANVVCTLIYFAITLQEQCLLSWPHFSIPVIVFWEASQTEGDAATGSHCHSKKLCLPPYFLTGLVFETTSWSLS